MSNSNSFNSYMERQIALLRAAGKVRTAETYEAAFRRFSEFLDGREIMFPEITPGLVHEFEEFLLGRHNCRNTTSFYMRVLRAVYNRGADNGSLRFRDPFRQVYTGVDKTRKRAVPVSVIRRLKALNLDGKEDLAKARDIFLFSFYTRGMSFIDMAYLRCSDLHGNELYYKRHKTGQDLRIQWEPEMQAIVDRWPAQPDGFLLPILDEPHFSRASLTWTPEGMEKERAAYLRQKYKSSILHTNRALARLSDMLHLQTPLTTYVARHSWATIAYSRNVPMHLISEAMGHGSERTTRIYLSSLSNSSVDRANKRIIKLL